MMWSAKRQLSAWIVAAALLGVTVTGNARQSDPPSFKAGSSELVVVPVTVTDKQGRLLNDLERDAFVVYDNDHRQEVAFFTHEDTPVSVALVIDNSGSMRPKVGEVMAATLAFARASHPEDELLVIEFNDDVRDALGGRWLTAGDAGDLEAALRSLRPDGQTALYNALIDGLDHLERATRARRVMVLISDGGDNASTTTFDEVLARARRSDVTIYTIGLFDEGSRDNNPGMLKRLAEATGGERFLPKSPGYLLQACQRIAHEIRMSYTLGYVPTTRDGAYHRLRVVLGDKGIGTVRTRPGYFAASAPTR
jgi:VWFA-related protein